MKRILYCALIALLALSGTAFAQKTGSQAVVYTLTVSVSPSVAGTVIKVDGVAIKGNSVSVRAGSHPVQVSAPGYEPYATVVTVRADMTLTVNLMSSGGSTAPLPTVAPTAAPTAAPVPQNYPLTIVLNVKGATVSVDGMEIRSNPVSLSAGTHSVTAAAPGFQPHAQTISLSGPMTLNITLQPDKPASYNLTVTIPGVRGATVWVDGVQMLRNPLAVAAGAHTVKASASGYQTWEQTITVDRNMNLSIPLQAQSYNLTVNIPGVRGASVWVDGVQMLRNPMAVAAGSHTVKATAPGYQNWEQAITVNGDMTLSIPLQPQNFPVTFSSDVKGIELLVDGIQQKTNPVQLSPGTHSVLARARGYSDFMQTITVSGPMTVNVVMRQRNAVLIINLKDFGSDKDEKGPRGDRAKAYGQYDVWVDGKAVKMNQDRVEILPGTHKITIAVAGLRAELEMSFEGGLQYLVEPVLTVKATPGVFFDEFQPSPSPVIFQPTPEPADLFSR